MDPRRNPFASGAGSPPPELAGRDEIIAAADVALHRVRANRPEKSQMLLGLRGVGKTVLLGTTPLSRDRNCEPPFRESLIPHGYR